MKRQYPLFMIDRDRTEGKSIDYITCLDRQVGFVASVMVTDNRQMIEQMHAQLSQVENAEISFFLAEVGNGNYLILTVLDFLYYFDLTNEIKTRIKVLLKKAVKKYVAVTRSIFPRMGKITIEEQIKAHTETVNNAKENFDKIIANTGSKEMASYLLAVNEEILKSLQKIKDLGSTPLFGDKN